MEPIIEIFYFCSILLVGLTLRAIPHIKYYFPGTPDTFFFLNKIKNPEYLSEEVLYPKLFDQTLRLFVRAGKFSDGRTTNRLSIVLDAITTSIIYFFIRSQFSAEIALFTALLFFITPFVVKQGSTLSARSFGLLFASTSLLCVTLPFPWHWFATGIVRGFCWAFNFRYPISTHIHCWIRLSHSWIQRCVYRSPSCSHICHTHVFSKTGISK